MKKDLYTVRDIAQELDVAEKSVRRLISTEQLDAAKVCGKWVITAENLKAFVDSKTGGGGKNGR